MVVNFTQPGCLLMAVRTASRAADLCLKPPDSFGLSSTLEMPGKVSVDLGWPHSGNSLSTRPLNIVSCVLIFSRIIWEPLHVNVGVCVGGEVSGARSPATPRTR